MNCQFGSELNFNSFHPGKAWLMKSPCETRVNVNPLKSGRYFPNGNSGGGDKKEIKGTAAEIKMER